jgi:hypothetical protein
MSIENISEKSVPQQEFKNLQSERRKMAILMDDSLTLTKITGRVLNVSSQNLEVDIVERFHMEAVRERYEDVLGSYEIFSFDRNAANLGFIMKNKKNPPDKTDWILTDLDDTMIGTQEVKSEREQRYVDYLSKLDINIPRKMVTDIIKTTDSFARWQDTPNGSKDCYHPIAHMASLQLITDSLKNAGNNSSADEILTLINKTLTRIKGELSGEEKPQNGDPFRMTADAKFIITVGSSAPWSEEIEDIFEHTMVAPPRYGKNIAAFKPATQSNSKIDVVNIGVFTSGAPSYQLYKMGELLREHPDLQFNALLFTRVGKDKFLREFLEREGIRDSMIVMYDDGIGNIRKLENLNLEPHRNAGNTIVGVVAKTPFAKDVDKQSEFPTFNHDSQTGDDIKTGLRIALNARDKRRPRSSSSL